MNMSKEKETNNRFRVVSSSLPHGNNKFNTDTNTNTNANNNNYYQVPKHNIIGDTNNTNANNKNSNNNSNNNSNSNSNSNGNTLGYRQLGGIPSSLVNRDYN